MWASLPKSNSHIGLLIIPNTLSETIVLNKIQMPKTNRKECHIIILHFNWNWFYQILWEQIISTWHEGLDLWAGERRWWHPSAVWKERKGCEDMNPLFYNFASSLPLFIEMGPQNGFGPATVVRISWTFNRYSIMPGNNDINKIDIISVTWKNFRDWQPRTGMDVTYSHRRIWLLLIHCSEKTVCIFVLIFQGSC